MPIIYNKRGNKYSLSMINPVLGSGELCLETDTNRIKFGDGITAWNSLQYAILPSGTSNGQFLQYNSASGMWFPTSSGNFTTLQVNGTGVSISGHTHSSSDITNFNSSVSGLLTPYQLALNNPVTGVGTSGYLTKWISSSGVSSGIIFDDGTNIGIGTNTPSNKLEIAGGNVLLFPTDNTKQLSFYSSSYGVKCQAGLEIFTGDRIRFRKGSTEFARIETDGKVGIGTTTPSGQLHVIGTGIISSNLGIGTNNPLDMIHVSGSSTGGQGIRLENADGYGGSIVADNGQLYVYSSTATAFRVAGRKIRLGDGSANACALELGSVGTISQDGNGGGLSFSGTIAQFSNGVNVTAGNVGIGTSTPSGSLDVAGDVYVRGTGNNLGTIYFKSQAVGDKTLYIGATNGGDLVMNGGGANIQLSSQGGYLNVIGMSTQMHIGHPYDAGNTSQIIRFVPAAKEMMRMTTSGTLGIGLPTLSSSYAGNTIQLFNQQPYANTRVHIAGSGADSGSAALIVTNSGISPLFYVRNDGNIGMGTTFPSAKLDVNGNVNIDGNLTFDSFTESVVAIGNSSTSQTLSLTSGTVQTCTLTGNCTFTMPTAIAGKSFTMFLNTGAGNYTASFSGVRWADSASPTVTILANKVDIYSFISDGSYWYGSFSQNYG